MKLSVNQPELHKALSFTHKIIPSKPQLPILSSVLFHADTDQLTISATDLFVGIKVSVDAGIQEGGTIVLPGKELKALIQSLPSEFITITAKNGTVTIKTNQTTVKLQTQNAQDFPEFPVIEGTSISLPTAQLEQMVHRAAYAASVDPTRPILTAFLWRLSEDKWEVVTTDGFRLAWQEFAPLQGLEDIQLLLPAKALTEIVSIAKQVSSELVEMKLDQNTKQALFKIGTVEKFVRLIDGTFPPYEKIMPSEFITKVTFDRQEIVDTLKRAMIFGKDSSQIVTFDILEDSVNISATSPTLGSFLDSIKQVAITGQTQQIAFNTKYLLDYLNTLSCDTILFEMNESLKPAQFTDPALISHRYIAMPFRVAT